ncbi:MAG: hypothetical protein ACHWZW_02755 [Spirulina sp.]
MAIKGLTDQRGVFPRIGKLRKGGPRKPMRNKDGSPRLDKHGNPVMGYGDDLDHFRFDSRDTYAAEAFRAAYGDTPRAINVRLPYPTIDENWSTAMERYGAGGIEVRCDREFMQGVRVKGKFIKCFPGRVPCQRDEAKEENSCGCKEVGRLNLIIPELGRFAYVTVETHSINDLVNLTQQLTAIEMTFGQLNGIPLLLTRRPEKISTPTAGGGRARREKWMLSIEVSPDWASRQIAAGDRYAMTLAEQPLLAGASVALPPAMMPDPEPPPPLELKPVSEDFMQSDLWGKIRSAFANLSEVRDIARYRDKALRYVSSGHLPPEARGSIAVLVDRAYERLAPKPPTPATVDVDIDPAWRDNPLWKDLVIELSKSQLEEAESFIKSVGNHIESGELPPIAGSEILKLINKKQAEAMQTKTVTVEVV